MKNCLIVLLAALGVAINVHASSKTSLRNPDIAGFVREPL